MKVSELVQTLDTVAPTLGATNMVPIMEHFWFTGSDVLTYDDHLAMQAPCDIGLKLTVTGKLLPLLKASYQSGVLKFTEQDDGLLVSIGKAKATLTTKNIRDASNLFKMPALEANAPELTNHMDLTRQAIEACRLAMDDTTPHRNGITLLPEDGALSLYAYNNDSLARCVLPGGKLKKRIMLPAAFWNILLSLIPKKDKANVKVMLREEHVLAQVGDVLLYAKTVEVAAPTDLRKLYDTNYTAAAKRLVPISAEFHEAIKRAAVLTKDDKNSKTTLTVENGELNVTTDALHGLTDDRVRFDHPDAHVTLKPAPLLEALERFTGEEAKVAIGKRVVALSEAGRVFLLSGTG